MCSHLPIFWTGCSFTYIHSIDTQQSHWVSEETQYIHSKIFYYYYYYYLDETKLHLKNALGKRGSE